MADRSGSRGCAKACADLGRASRLPAAIYSAIAAMPDAGLLRRALAEMVRDTAPRADMARNPARLHGPRAKPHLPEADA